MSLLVRENPTKVKDGEAQIRLGGVTYNAPLHPLKKQWFENVNPQTHQLRVSGVPQAIADKLVEYLRQGFGKEKQWIKSVSPELFLDLQIWGMNMKLQKLQDVLVETVKDMFASNPEKAQTLLRLTCGRNEDSLEVNNK